MANYAKTEQSFEKDDNYMSPSRHQATNKRKKCETKQSPSKYTKDYNKRSSIKSWNDISWHAKSKQLLQNVASLSFNDITGLRFNMTGPQSSGPAFKYTSGSVSAARNETVPGVMRLGMTPAFGISMDASSTINMCSLAQYTTIVKEQSSSKPYDHTDLMLMEMAVDSPISLLTFMTRAYATLMSYSYSNRYLPTSLFKAYRLDYNDFLNNAANFKTFINLYAAKVASFNVPKALSIYRRHSWMYSAFYADSDINKAQYYAFCPDAFYTYVELEEDTLPYLKYTPFPGTANDMTFTQLVNYANALIEPLIESESINKMNADLAKRYNGEFYTVAMINDPLVIAPVYDVKVLEMIHNMTILQGTISNANLTQSGTVNPYLQWNPQFTASEVSGMLLNRLLSVRSNDPNPELVMESTRATIGCKSSNAGTYTLDETSDSICTSAAIIMNDFNDTTNTPVFYKFSANHTIEAGQSEQAITALWFLTELEKFDWHPPVVLATTVPATGAVTYSGVYTDIDNYVVVTNEILGNLHRVSLMSQLDLPINPVDNM